MNAFQLYQYKDIIQHEVHVLMGSIMALIRAKSEVEVNKEEDLQKEWILLHLKKVQDQLTNLNDKMMPILDLAQNNQ